ncbi:MAG: PEGA domain-containing protein [Bradymonadia bacterium]
MWWLTLALITLPALVFAQTKPSAQAPKVRQRLAVLELTDTTGQQSAAAVWLGETIRTRAARRMGDHWLLITRENILAMLPPGVDLASCEGDCEVETGRNIGAHALLTGTLSSVEGRWRINLHLYDTDSGALLKSHLVRADGLGALERPLQSAVDDLLDALPNVLSSAEAGIMQAAPTMRAVGEIRRKRMEARPFVAPSYNREAGKEGLHVIVDRFKPAQIFVDGRSLGSAPLWLPPSPNGQWTFQVRASGHHPLEVEVVSPNRLKAAWEVKVPLAPAWDKVRIHSTLPGAIVLIDGQHAGRTPHTTRALSPGAYRIKVTHPCAENAFEREIMVRGTESFLDVRADLQSHCGALAVQSEPSGATIYAPFQDTLDLTTNRQDRYSYRARYRDQDRFKTPHRFDQLPPGRFVIRVALEGYRSQEIEVEIKPGETAQVGLPMTPLFGEAEITAEDFLHRPCTGYVEVDGREVGRAPWRGRLQAGRHDITVGCGVAQEAEGEIRVMEDELSTRAFTAEDRALDLTYRTNPHLGAHYFGFGGWFDDRRPWRLRQGAFFDFGFQGFGAKDDPWGIPGWSVGYSYLMSVPLGTPRLELVTGTRLAIGGVSCSADAQEANLCRERGGDTRDTLGLFSLRGGGRVNLGSGFAEGGMQVQLPFGASDFELEPIVQPYISVGLSF